MKLAQLQQHRRFLLGLPLLVLPFLALIFHNLHDGRGDAKPAARRDSLGLNTQLPSPAVDPTRAFENKLKAYQLADTDSTRKAQYQRQDPYRRDSPMAALTGAPAPLSPAKPVPPASSMDNRANRLLRQLEKLQQSIHQSPPLIRPGRQNFPAAEPAAGRLQEPGPDPQLDRLNAMLDKLIRIQHPNTQQPAATLATAAPDEVAPADSTANTLRATISEDQTLTNGATVALRLADPIRVEGRILSAGRLVFGTAGFNNDRLLINIHSVREDANLYTVDWQVFDLDGLPGIHMPALLGRDVAKQSADQGIGSLNVFSADPTLGAQAAGAGIQAARSFLSHKVRQLRVKLSAGYQVLLRPLREPARPHPPTPRPPAARRIPPEPDETPDGPVLAKARNGGVELVLRDVRIQDSCLWFGLEWKNRSSIAYSPAYARWCIRSRAGISRTALQEQTVEAAAAPELPAVGAGTIQFSWFGFSPFALSKEKQLVLLVGERSGDRVLTLKIHSHQLLNAKTDVTNYKAPSEETDNGDLHR